MANTSFADFMAGGGIPSAWTNYQTASAESTALCPEQTRKQIVPYSSSDEEDDGGFLDPYQHPSPSSRPPPPSPSEPTRPRRPRKTRRIISNSSSATSAPHTTNMDTTPTRDASPRPTSPSPTPSSNTIDLDLASPSTRQTFYTTYFTTAPLSTLSHPPICTLFPTHAPEILSAYTTHTTFFARILINFDAADGVFFETSRANACGKLLIPSRQLAALTALNPTAFELKHLQLSICTPFRQLATLHVQVPDTGASRLIVQGDMKPPSCIAGHAALRSYLLYCARLIRHTGIRHGTTGLTIRDVQAFAELFHRLRSEDPGDDREWECESWGGGEWTELGPERESAVRSPELVPALSPEPERGGSPVVFIRQDYLDGEELPALESDEAPVLVRPSARTISFRRGNGGLRWGAGGEE